MVVFGFFAAISLGVVIYCIVRWQLFLRKYRLPPGPNIFQVIKSLLDYAAYPTEVVNLATEWYIQYGPLQCFYLLNRVVVSLNTVDVAYKALRKIEFGDRPNVASLQLLSGGGNNIGQSPMGPRWRLHRKLAIRGLRFFLQGDTMDAKINKAFKETTKYLESMKGPFDPKSAVDITFYNLFREFLVNKSYRHEDEEFKKMVEVNDALIMEFGNCMLEDVFPSMLNIYHSRKYRITAENIKHIQDTIGWNELKVHKENFNPEKLEDYMDLLIDEQRKIELSGDPDNIKIISDMHIVMNVVDMFTAGTDTSRSTLNWIIKFLVIHPEIQDKMRDEIDNAIGRDHLPRVMEKNKLPYCEAVMLETMRIRPPLPFALMQNARCDTKLCGYDIPKDAIIGLNLWAVHHDPSEWKDPHMFKPERFITNGNLDKKQPSLLSFGAGIRACLGESTAKTELILLLACLIQNFRFRLPDNVTDLDMSPDGCCFVHVPRPYQVIVEKIVI